MSKGSPQYKTSLRHPDASSRRDIFRRFLLNNSCYAEVQRTLIFVEKSRCVFIKVRSTVTMNERYFGATHLTKRLFGGFYKY
jgi:hypothetical protein